MVGKLKTVTTGNSHSFAIYEDPAILDKIPTICHWNEDQLAMYRQLQHLYDEKSWYSSNISHDPGHFASDQEYWFYRLFRWRDRSSKYLLLSNVPLQSIIGVSRDKFENWYSQQNYKSGALQDAFRTYSRLVGAKSVDLIIVDKATGHIACAVEVDGEAHLTDQSKIKWDRTKSYHFRILKIPLLRISTDSVLRLWSTATSETHDARFDEALKKMNRHWTSFVSGPTVQNMHLHFTDPIVVSLPQSLDGPG